MRVRALPLGARILSAAASRLAVHACMTVPCMVASPMAAWMGGWVGGWVISIRVSFVAAPKPCLLGWPKAWQKGTDVVAAARLAAAPSPRYTLPTHPVPLAHTHMLTHTHMLMHAHAGRGL